MMRNGEAILPLNKLIKKAHNIRSTNPKKFKERYAKALEERFKRV